MNISFLNTAFVFLVSVFGVGLALWVYLADKKNKINLFFLLFTITMVSYLVFSYLSHYPGQLPLALLWKRLFLATITLFLIFTYFFSVNFPRRGQLHPFLDKVIVVSEAIFFFLILFTSFVAKGIKVQTWGTDVIWGPGKEIWFIAMIVYTYIIVGQIIKKYFILNPKEKLQTQYFLVGILIFSISNFIFNMLLPVFLNTYRYHSYGDYSTVFLLGFTAFAISKHQLFNIKVIATETIVLVLSIALFVEIFLSNNSMEGFVKALIWVIASYGGWALIKSVKLEIRRKEELAILAKQLEEANQHLKDVDKLKDDFLSMASHELNTPIAAIEGYLSMILQEGMGGVIPDKAKKYLESVFQSAQMLARLVKDLLNVSRIESGRIHLIYEQKSIEEIIDQSIMSVASKAREMKHTLTFEKPASPLPKTWFDVTRITEIVINMLGNSIKYTDPGGKITVRAVNDANKIVVSVEDNGKGIPKDKADRVFEKFTQVDVLKDEVKGTGLGMYIAKKFIDLHKGQIWFKSDGEGKGSTFYFSLPILKDKPIDEHEGEGPVLH